MSQHQAAGSTKAKDEGHGGPKRFKITVDGKHLESTESRLTGLQIKALAGVDTNFGLFLEGRGQAADRPIGDGEILDLESHGKETFYTVPPANYGARISEP